MLTLALATLLALAPVQAFNQGNQLYARKDYARAVLAYREALRAGHDARVDYNLGNALFKSGRIGEAIAEYRRARSLAPRDRDIAANLAFARAYRLDKSVAGAGPVARLLDAAFHLLSRREASAAAAVLFTLASFVFAWWIVRRGRWPATAAAGCGLAALLCLVTRQVWNTEVDSRPAVVVVPEVSATSGPGEESKQILLVHDGSELLIRETRGEYLLVQLPGGTGGWLRKGAVEAVY